MLGRKSLFILWIIFVGTGCAVSKQPVASPTAPADVVTLIFTNDLESAYDPIPAYWRDDIERIGGVAELTSLVKRIRAEQPNVFFFDSGDIYTGTLSKLTQGELAFELMLTMGYDAMAIGNHEFEYGWHKFAEQKHRASFPVLGANLFYKNTDIPYAQPYTVIERDGIRLGVIGILGQDAGTALIPSNIAGVDVRDPIPVVARYVAELRDSVDLIVLLTHQGKTAPMQTDDEGRPDVQRDIDADIRLAGSVEGIDVLLGGHADAGTREPVVHPRTGTLIMQTYGQGQHLGYLQLRLDRGRARVASFDGRLIDIDSDSLTADSAIAAKLERYRSRFPEVYETVGRTTDRINRQYNLESDLGNLYADILREFAEAEIGLMPSGALRKDLPKGEIAKIDLLDSFPFTDRVAVMELSGATLRAIIEQGLSLERGILQVSGLDVSYDADAPEMQRINDVRVGNESLVDDRIYRVATIEILAQGGDAYERAKEAKSTVMMDNTFASVLLDYFGSNDAVAPPSRGRLMPVP